MEKLLLPIFVFFSSTQPTFTKELLRPDPSIPPERVVEIQLQALQTNDHPSRDFGIVQTWIFAHPKNKRITGPMERFAVMIKGPNYKMMINHRQHIIKSVVVTNSYALFDVSIITQNQLRASFKWEVSKVSSGPNQGSWMTTAVSPPIEAKDTV